MYVGCLINILMWKVYLNRGECGMAKPSFLTLPMVVDSNDMENQNKRKKNSKDKEEEIKWGKMRESFRLLMFIHTKVELHILYIRICWRWDFPDSECVNNEKIFILFLASKNYSSDDHYRAYVNNLDTYIRAYVKCCTMMRKFIIESLDIKTI